MVGIALASHGALADGIRRSAEMIFGPQGNVVAVGIDPDMGPDDFRAKVLEAVETFSQKEQVLFLVDLWGGTPFNQISKLIEERGGEDWVAVTGMNLPMVIAAYGERMGTETAKEIAQAIYPEARDGIRVKPALPETDVTARERVPAVAAHRVPAVDVVPESTVSGEGRLQIVLARIDTRLLHGQVATTWTKTVRPDRIIVCSDAVAHDDLRKSMIEQAAPPGVKAHVVPISKIIEVAHDPRFGNTRAMLLFETPQDLLRALEGGVDIREVNLGSMAHSAGKVVVTNAVALGPDDIATLQKIEEHGVVFDIRKVPGDSSASLGALLQKAKTELANAQRR